MQQGEQVRSVNAIFGEKFGGGVSSLERGHLVEVAVVHVREHGPQRIRRPADVHDDAVRIDIVGPAELDVDDEGGAVKTLRRAEHFAVKAVRDHQVVAQPRWTCELLSKRKTQDVKRITAAARRLSLRSTFLVFGSLVIPHAMAQRVERAVRELCHHLRQRFEGRLAGDEHVERRVGQRGERERHPPRESQRAR